MYITLYLYYNVQATFEWARSDQPCALKADTSDPCEACRHRPSREAVQLKRRGGQTALTFANRHEWCDLVERSRVDECAAQVWMRADAA